MNEGEITEHIKSMIEQMPSRIDNPYKWNRWLGFMQGCLYCIGWRTIEQMKKDNKGGLASALSIIKKRLFPQSHTRNNWICPNCKVVMPKRKRRKHLNLCKQD